MPNKKHVVEIDKDAKRLRRIFENLDNNRECIIESENPEWGVVLRKYGNIIQKKELNDFIEPMWIHSSKETRKVERRLIRLTPIAEIEKNIGNNKIFFKFRKRRLI